MTLRSFFFCFTLGFVALIFPSYTYAQKDFCGVEDAFQRLEAFSSEEIARQSRIIEPLAEKLLRYTNKAQNNSIPTGAQLSAKENADFREISLLIFKAQLRQLVLSNLERDTFVNMKLAQIADERISSTRAKDNNLEDYKQLYLFAWGVIPDSVKNELPPQGGCTVYAALLQKDKENIKANQSKELNPNRNIYAKLAFLQLRADMRYDSLIKAIDKLISNDDISGIQLVYDTEFYSENEAIQKSAQLNEMITGKFPSQISQQRNLQKKSK